MKTSPAAAQATRGNMNDNPLLTESTLPLRYPRFDALRNEHFAPAFEQGMAGPEFGEYLVFGHAGKPAFR